MYITQSDLTFKRTNGPPKKSRKAKQEAAAEQGKAEHIRRVHQIQGHQCQHASKSEDELEEWIEDGDNEGEGLDADLEELAPEEVLENLQWSVSSKQIWKFEQTNTL
ncbi:hypothetical protein BDQ17DRAFT_1339001 [Cyathus striatus]|nr:hypothetical protein BDQ17DRAFT_1339001 [Cyathus striatus]